MPPAPKQLTLEERLREIEREKARLEKDMKALRKGRMPIVKSAPRAGTEKTVQSEPDNTPRLSPSTDLSERANRDDQFLNYLASGSFNSRRPLLRHERKQQRNKALFMLGVLALVAYVVWTLFKSS